MKKPHLFILCVLALPLPSEAEAVQNDGAGKPKLTLQSYLKRSEALYKAALDVQKRIEHLKGVQYGLEEDTDPLAAEIAVDAWTFQKAQELQRKAKEILEPCK